MSKKSGVFRNLLHNIRALGQAPDMRSGTPEDPANPITGDFLQDGFGGSVLTDKSIIGNSAVWKGVNLYARDVGKLPLEIFKRVDAGKEKALDHPAYRLLKTTPNENQNAFQFRMDMQARAILRGNGYAFIQRNGSGKPVSINPLPNSTILVREKRNDKDVGKIWAVTDPATAKVRIPYRDILHIRGMGTVLTGFSLAFIAAESLNLGANVKTYGESFFVNGAAPMLTLETDQKLTPEAIKNLSQSWAKMHQGATNAWKTTVLEQGLKVKPFSISNKDSQFLELRQFERAEIANFLLLQPHKVGDTSRAAFNSLEMENRSYLDESLDPWLVIWEQECFHKLLTEREKREFTHVVEFNRNALLRADTATRFEAYTKSIGTGIMTINEVRSRENLNSIEGGDSHYVPVNLAVVQDDGSLEAVNSTQEPEPDPPNDDTDDEEDARGDLVAAHTAAIRAPIKRMVTRIRKATKRGKIDETKERDIITEACTPAVNAAQLSLSLEMRVEIIADTLLDNQAIVQDNVVETIVSTLLGSEENETGT